MMSTGRKIKSKQGLEEKDRGKGLACHQNIAGPKIEKNSTKLGGPVLQNIELERR